MVAYSNYFNHFILTITMDFNVLWHASKCSSVYSTVNALGSAHFDTCFVIFIVWETHKAMNLSQKGHPYHFFLVAELPYSTLNSYVGTDVAIFDDPLQNHLKASFVYLYKTLVDVGRVMHV